MEGYLQFYSQGYLKLRTKYFDLQCIVPVGGQSNSVSNDKALVRIIGTIDSYFKI